MAREYHVDILKIELKYIFSTIIIIQLQKCVKFVELVLKLTIRALTLRNHQVSLCLHAQYHYIKDSYISVSMVFFWVCLCDSADTLSTCSDQRCLFNCTSRMWNIDMVVAFSFYAIFDIYLLPDVKLLRNWTCWKFETLIDWSHFGQYIIRVT